MRLFKTSLLFLLLLFFLFAENLEAGTSHFPDDNFFSGNSDSGTPGAAEIVIESRIARLNEFTPIDLDYNGYVRDYILLFTGPRRKDMEKMLGFSDYYFPMIETYLDRYQLPFELKYLAVLESGLDPFAVSGSGAVGLWQFLLHSARMFNLEINSFIDERRDPVKSTEAACRYLLYLFDMFNDWHLALSAYNGGPGAVRTAIERAGGNRNFWEIREFMPEQTRNYVPAFIAITYLMNHYTDHGFVPQRIPGVFERTDTIWAKQPLSFRGISEVLNISPEVLSVLNPSFKTGYIPNAGGIVPVVLPLEYIPAFYQFEYNIYNLSSERQGKQYNSNPLKEFSKTVVHRVEKGEFLHKIALRYKCTPEQIKSWNALQGDTIHEGQQLIIWVTEDLYELINDGRTELNQTGKSLFLQ